MSWLTRPLTMGGSRAPQLNRVAILGDSFMQRQTNLPVGLLDGLSIQATNDAQFMNYGSVNWVNAYLGGGLELVYNGGVGAESSAQIAARVPAVIASGAGTCFCNGGINDSNTDSAAAIADRVLGQIISPLLAAGLLVIYESLPASALPSIKAKVTEANRRIQSAMHGRENFVFVDSYTPGLDPASSTSAALASWSEDGLHRNTRGSEVFGKIVADQIRPLIGANAKVKLAAGTYDDPANNANSIQRLANPCFTAPTGGSVETGTSGTIPASFSMGRTIGSVGTCVGSNEAGPNGNKAIFTFADCNATQFTFGQYNFQSRITPGKIYFGACAIDISSAVNLAQVALSLESNWASTNHKRVGMAAGIGNMRDGAYDQFIIVTPPLYVPSGVTMASFHFLLNLLWNQAGGAVVRASQMSCWEFV